MGSENKTCKHRYILGLGAAMLALLALTAQAGPEGGAKKVTEWIHPAIPGFGGVHPRDDVAVRPDPTQDYKIFVDVISGHQDKEGNYVALNRLARIVNLMAYAKVPADHVHIVALLDEKTGFAALTDEYYRKRFDTANPNLGILHALKKAGVRLMVCSQAMAGLGLPDKAIDPSVTITLSALTDAIVYGHRGYTYMQL